MRELGITGAVRGRKVITTIADPAAERVPDRLDRDFVADAPHLGRGLHARRGLGRHRLRRVRRGHLLPPPCRLVRRDE